MKSRSGLNIHTVIIVLFIGLLTIPSLSHSSSLFDDLKSGGFENILEKRKIRNWNAENKGQVIIKDPSRLGCGSYKQENGLSKDCRFSSKIKNNSDKFISCVVLKIIIMNKTTGKIIVEEKETFDVSIVPTATKDIIVYFDNENFKNITEQLENNWEWDFEFIGSIPQDMTFYSSNYNWL